MKKHSLIAVLCLSAALAFAGCTKENQPTTEPGGETGLTVKATATPFITPTPASREEAAIKFSIEENFLSATGRLELSAEGVEAIYYTTDGSVPDKKSTKYKSSIALMASNEVKAYSITARALYKDGSWSDCVTRTYFVGRNIEKRYDCLVISLTTDPDNLWDYETGIFTGGKILADYLAAHPGTNVDGSTPANYNQLRGMEGERPIYLEVFNSDGSLILSQDAGVRVYGGWSRTSAMKPLKLFARKEYSETNNKFRYPFFTTAFDENEELIDSFKRLVLRASGNDNGFAFIREELFQTLAKQAGYLGKAVRPCAVYINGEYYGAYWLTEVYHESYFEAHYGKFAGEMKILEGTETHISADEEEDKAAAEEYNNLYAYYSEQDLTDDAVYRELCELVDVQNYLEYYAYEIFLGNQDWPHNNYKIYRYYATEGENYTEAPFDGKWRYLIHDTDYSTGIYGEAATDRSYIAFLGKMDGVKSNCPLFGQLMRRDDCKAIFITKMLDLVNGVFAEDYFNEQLDTLNASRMNEQNYSYTSGKIESWVQPYMLDERIADLKKWIKARANFMYNNTSSFFKLRGVNYTLDVEVDENKSVSINSWTVTSNFSGRYYDLIDTVLKAEDEYGRSAIAWLVDGERVEGATITLNTENVNSRAKITVKPIFE